ncbi:MAG: hypothetical protein Kow00108_11250 [Calditrichia bacterium]
MKEDILKDILIKIQFLSERELQAIERAIERQRRLKMLLTEQQPQLPLFSDMNQNRAVVQ